MGRVGSKALVFVAILIAAVVLAACGSDSSTSSDTSSTGGETSTEGTSTTAAEPTGKPVKVLVTSFVNSPLGDIPELWAGAEVAAEHINEEGGINGQPIQVIACNGKGDGKAELACARKGASEGAVAGDSNVFQIDPEGAYEVLNQGGVTDVAGAGGVPALFSLPNEYPIEFSAADFSACAAPEALEAVGKDVKVGVVYAQNPYAESGYKMMEAYLNSSGLKAEYAGAIAVPNSLQDFSPVVQELDEKGANYIVVITPPTEVAQFVTTAASAGKKWSFCTDAGLVGPEALEELGPLTENFLTAVGFPPISSASKYPLVNQFVEEMTAAGEAGKEGADLRLNPYNSMRPWMGMQAIKQVAEGIDGEVTIDSFAEAIKNAKVDLDYATIDFSKPLGTAPYERVFQPTGFISKWNSGENELEEVAQVNMLETSSK
jgi:branched-chain amino acid transport system substrate-binding protein